jgi:hypothetical protein
VAVGVLLLAGLTGLVGAQPGASAGAATVNGSSVTGGGATLPMPVKHVFLIMMENEETGVIYGHQPYETQLANTYAWGGDANSNPDHVGYYAVCHPSAPNYLALTSGLALQCGSDAFNNFSVNNLGNELQTANESWIDYEESANVPCQQYDSGLYVERHNPFVYYTDLGGNTTGSACRTHVLPIANLTQDYPYNSTPPAFTYIAPNILNDGHSSSAAVADWWLSTFIPKLVAEPWFSSSAIFIAYDEAYTFHGNENFTGYDNLRGGPVYVAAVSPYTLGMGALTTNSSHYDLLTTMEWLLGLTPMGGKAHDGTPAFPAITAWFKPKLFGPARSLQYTDLEGTSLAGYDLAADNLQYANLSGANLQGADLRGTDLQYADLAGADLQGADLRGADLQYADLAGASLQGADLQGAYLQYADLGGAWLTGLGPGASELTNFDGASLYQANLVHAVCGSPSYIVAAGANINAVGVPAACSPPL